MEISSINGLSNSDKIVSVQKTQSGKILSSMNQQATPPLRIDICEANTDEEPIHFDVIMEWIFI